NAMPQKRRTDPAPTILGQDEYVFEVEGRSRAERRVALEENGVADRRRLVLPEGKPCFEARTLTEAIFDQAPLLFGIRWRQLLELREGGDQCNQSGRIGAEGAPEDERFAAVLAETSVVMFLSTRRELSLNRFYD